MTENNKGWICYDGECDLCRTWAGRTYRILRHRNFRLVALQVPWVRTELQLPAGAPDEMQLLLPNGQTFSGADAFIQIARHIWWAYPAFAFAQLPGVTPLLRTLYSSLAKRRHCFNGACRVPNHKHSPITSAFYELP